jgi:3-methyl-2-oxobutanoate hydroxymethyltransferase
MPADEPPVTVLDFARWKQSGRKISVLTAYDFTTARTFDEAGIDCLLVGDSLGVVVQGHPNTLGVTLDQIVYHTEIVARAARRALVVADLPFLSYQASIETAMQAAGRCLKEARCGAVKLEGGRRSAATVRALVEAGIPIMGHVGLTPQSVHQFGGFKVQRDGDALAADALALAEAGAFAVVLECIPAALAERITAELPVPTIGIGAGAGCDGQVLVAHDMLGLFEGFRPRFVRRYAELAPVLRDAAARYAEDVREGRFPGPDESFA